MVSYDRSPIRIMRTVQDNFMSIVKCSLCSVVILVVKKKKRKGERLACNWMPFLTYYLTGTIFFRMKRKFYSWEECMNLREVKVNSSIYLHIFDNFTHLNSTEKIWKHQPKVTVGGIPISGLKLHLCLVINCHVFIDQIEVCLCCQCTRLVIQASQ